MRPSWLHGGTYVGIARVLLLYVVKGAMVSQKTTETGTGLAHHGISLMGLADHGAAARLQHRCLNHVLNCGS